MPDETSQTHETSAEAARYLRALVVFMAADRDDRVDDRPPARSELILADAGFSAREISSMTGRNYEAVRSMLRRRA